LTPHKDKSIEVKSPGEIAIMRKAGKILKDVLDNLVSLVSPGMTTWDFEFKARRLFQEKGVKPAFLGYMNYPAVLCTSINEEVVHGIPSKRRILKNGDLLKIDAGLLYKGFYADSARTVPVGDVNDESHLLIEVTKKALWNGIGEARAGKRLGDISYAIQTAAETVGFSVVREYTGHGIGRSLHEPPQIPNFGNPNRGPRLKTGMVFAIEPMVNAGGWETRVLKDNWTVVTADGRRSAHFEHTIAITKDSPEIFT